MKPIYREFNKEQLEREYSPSSRVDDINVFLQQYADQSKEVRESLSKRARSFLDLSYGEKNKQNLDLFVPKNITGTPLHIFIHGGYWQLLDKSDSSFGAKTFIDSNIAFCAINYTLAPDANIEEIINEVRQAITWLYKNAETYGYNRDNITVSGSSAGAHLAAMLLYTNWTDYHLPSDVIKGVCAVSGIYDLTPIQKTYINEPLNLTDRQILNCSPIRLKSITCCPVIIAYGDNETDEFKRQSIEYGITLKSQGFDVIFQEIKDRNHFDVILDIATPGSWLTKQILLQIKEIASNGQQNYTALKESFLIL